jgi:putative ABC transport system permease protein
VVDPSPALGVLVALLTLAAVVTVGVARLPLRRDVAVAALRAAAQLAAVSAVIVLVLRSLVWTAVFLVGMFAVAAVTSAQRTRAVGGWRATAPPLAAGTLPVVTAVTASGVVPWAPASLLPVTGIVLGGAMVATTLATRRMTDELRARAGEYEAALALGFLPREAVLEIARPAAGLALVPGLDQTRTVGLVTLPGAFVGVLLAGGSPAEAGAAQLLVLVGLLAAQSLAVLTTVELVARRRLTTPDLAARLPS